VNKFSEYFNVPADFLLGRGIFASWDVINEYWEVFLAAMSSIIPQFDAIRELLPTDNRILITHAASSVINRIEFDEATKHFKVVYYR
jgi:hypothetical protein